jgi:hypothetical protein
MTFLLSVTAPVNVNLETLQTGQFKSFDTQAKTFAEGLFSSLFQRAPEVTSITVKDVCHLPVPPVHRIAEFADMVPITMDDICRLPAPQPIFAPVPGVEILAPTPVFVPLSGAEILAPRPIFVPVEGVEILAPRPIFVPVEGVAICGIKPVTTMPAPVDAAPAALFSLGAVLTVISVALSIINITTFSMKIAARLNPERFGEWQAPLRSTPSKVMTVFSGILAIGSGIMTGGTALGMLAVASGVASLAGLAL